MDIFERLLAGEPIPMDDPDYGRIRKAVKKTISLTVQMNAASDLNEVRALLSEIIGEKVDQSTTVFPPFYTNFGRHISIGKNVIINHCCSFLDLGGIKIEDDVMIAPCVNISSEGHPVKPSERRVLVPRSVIIRKNVWIGAGSTILPGVTIGQNSVIAAGAVVTKDVPPNTLVGGIPAKEMRSLD